LFCADELGINNYLYCTQCSKGGKISAEHTNAKVGTWVELLVKTRYDSPMSEEKEYLSKEKFDELSKELKHLKSVRRKEIAGQLEFAKGLGDLSENAEYHEARQNQAETEERIAKLEQMIKNAVITEKHKGGIVGIGSTVVIIRDGDKTERRYQIVGSEESNTKENKISNKSPLGEALMGKSKGDKASCETPAGVVSCRVVDVE
jgi:transcription elongation factor GreA